MTLDKLIEALKQAREHLGENTQVYIHQQTVSGPQYLSDIDRLEIKPPEDLDGLRISTPRVTIHLKV